MNDNINYKKYIKYKKKYLFLKNQMSVPLYKNNILKEGGNNFDFFDSTIGFDFFGRQKIILKKRFGDLIKSYESDKFGIIDIVTNENLYFKNAENIDRNIIICNYDNSSLDDNYMTEFSFEYLTDVLKKHPDTNLFISFAPLNVKDFYLPKFLEEFLDSNVNEKLTIIFIGKNYSDNMTNFFLNMSVLNNYLKLIKEKYSERINLIHVYVNFRFILHVDNKIKLTNDTINSEILTSNFLYFLNNNYRNEKLNILYIGFNACGLIENINGIENTDYILIGCDCVKYKNNVLSLPEKNYKKITINNSKVMIDVIDSNKITYEMIKCIKKIK
jgi:hypothetical protein